MRGVARDCLKIIFLLCEKKRQIGFRKNSNSTKLSKIQVGNSKNANFVRKTREKSSAHGKMIRGFGRGRFAASTRLPGSSAHGKTLPGAGRDCQAWEARCAPDLAISSCYLSL
jgi:hypothetical protein